MISASVVKGLIWGKGGGALTPIWGVLVPQIKLNHIFLLLAESIIFLHSYIISIFNFFGKILQHPKINPGSTPDTILLAKFNMLTSSSLHFLANIEGAYNPTWLYSGARA